MFMVLCFMFFEYECRKVDMIAYWQAHGIRSTLARVWFCRDIAIMPYVICKLCTHICDMHPLLWTPTSTHWRTRTDNHCAVTLCKIKQSNILWHVRIKFFQPQKHDFTSSMFFLHNIYTYIYILYIDIHPIYIIYIYISYHKQAVSFFVSNKRNSKSGDPWGGAQRCWGLSWFQFRRLESGEGKGGPTGPNTSDPVNPIGGERPGLTTLNGFRDV